MAERETYSGSSTGPIDGPDLLDQYAARVKTLFDASVLPLTSVGGTGNAVTATLDPPLDGGGLVNGMKFTITWGAANSGAVTLAINGGSAVPVVDADGAALGASALASGRRSLIEYLSGSFRILSSAGGAGAGAGPAYQAFTSSGTWTKPSGYDDDTVVMVEIWGAGGSGSRPSGGSGGGGGGGSYAARLFRIGDLPSSVTVTIGSGGSPPATNSPGNAGGGTSFGALLSAFGGGGGQGLIAGAFALQGGSGAGELAAGVAPASANGSLGSAAVGGAIGGGGSGQNAGTLHGGGGGASASTVGSAVFGGAGGSHGSGGSGGVSKYGGNGGNAVGAAGSAPGGGGSGGTSGTAAGAGARGECRVTIFG
ncbi:hypothetical protein G5V65_21010 [Rhodobacter sp. HX-7-19]|uniref:Glycine-rich domain-containing protein n=1 Tax=Paragemmobacter kunshanensis TaxID=2583234 RepID=A0A6M1TYP6_9RHOB|nr:hypothetical protein [Rhodobacter kunshanensis]NGQ93370.1 hypothetical protein [Rhodobacter kunshanensis]